MSDACPMPVPPDEHEQRVIARLVNAKRIAIVGLSDDPMRASHEVARYLQSVGKQIVPVNPNCDEVLGVRCYPSLLEVPGGIDLVDVFRRPEACPAVVKDAIDVGAKGVWLQAGIVSPQARQLAEAAGLDYVENRCLMVEHRRQSRR